MVLYKEALHLRCGGSHSDHEAATSAKSVVREGYDTVKVTAEVAIAIAIVYIQVPKLSDGEIRGVDDLPPFLSADAHAFLRLLNHRNITGANLWTVR
jgi:hypothetical protein